MTRALAAFLLRKALISPPSVSLLDSATLNKGRKNHPMDPDGFLPALPPPRVPAVTSGGGGGHKPEGNSSARAAPVLVGCAFPWTLPRGPELPTARPGPATPAAFATVRPFRAVTVEQPFLPTQRARISLNV